ncbi:MAG: hypothetical protein ACKVZJ_10520 [Phycisphaerales bacterium]
MRHVAMLGAAALAIIGCGSSAIARASFDVNTIDAGGIPGGSLGNPIVWSGGAAFQAVNGSDSPPTWPDIQFDPALGFDSYVAIDPVGPSSFPPGYTARGPDGIFTPGGGPSLFSTAALSGVWFTNGPDSGFVGSGAGDRIFIAQITLRLTSSGPNTQGVLVNLRDSGTGNAGALGLLRFGLANASNNGGLWAQSYYLDVETRAVSGVSPTFNGGTSYAIYIRAIPAPGVGGVLVLAGVAAARRVRRAG